MNYKHTRGALRSASIPFCASGCRHLFFFVLCFSLFAVCSACGRQPAYRFTASASGAGAETVGIEEAAKTADRAESSDPSEVSGTGGDASAGAEPEVAQEPATIQVYVCGAVWDPGVYELPVDGRVYQALEAAGGPTEDAELRSLNQAAHLTDGEQITVYTKQELEDSGGLPGTDPAAQAGGETGKVNLNTAGREELMSLPGIGEARAQAIIAYREAKGPFTAIEEVMNIEGIKEKAFSKIKDEIEV